MTIYLIVYCLLFLFALLERLDDRGEASGVLLRKNFYFICAVGLVFFGALRYETGFDYFSYENIYQWFSGGLSAGRFEPGFAAFMHICKNIFGLSYPYFLFLLTASSLLIKFSFFYKYFKYPVFLLLMYFPAVFLYADFGQIRQGMAVGIFLWAIPAIKNRKLFRFLIIWLTACSFHYSALIFFPIYWFYKIKVTPKIFWAGLIFCFLFNAVSGAKVIFYAAMKIMGSSGLGEIMEYALGYGESANPLSFFLEINTLLVLCLIPLYQKVYANTIKNGTEKHLEFSGYNVYILMFLLIKMFDSISVIGYRGAYFYKMMEGILFYYLLSGLKERELKALLFLAVFLYGLVRLFFIIQKQQWAYVPYRIFSDFFI